MLYTEIYPILFYPVFLYIMPLQPWPKILENTELRVRTPNHILVADFWIFMSTKRGCEIQQPHVDTDKVPTMSQALIRIIFITLFFFITTLQDEYYRPVL